MSELKPCPFCGSEDLSILKYPQHETFYIYCNFCYTEGPDKDYQSEQQAIEAWNKRHD